MRLIVEAIHAMGAVLLQISVGLLIEELMFGGLVRLILAPRSATSERKGRKDTGEDRCSH